MTSVTPTAPNNTNVQNSFDQWIKTSQTNTIIANNGKREVDASQKLRAN